MQTKSFLLRELLSLIPKKYGYILLIMILVGQIQIFAADNHIIVNSEQQQTTVTGTVTDKQGEPLPGVTVLIKGTQLGAICDVDGKFSIAVSDKNAVLTFSLLGYVTKEVVVGNQTNLTIMMDEDVRLIDEVVVVGYGTKKKETLTGSVVSIQSADLIVTKNPNIQNMLTGKLPGVRNIQKTSEPGQFTNQFDIRGMGSPLLVVDGVPRGDLPRMDPNDIESVSVLKDASAAIYGMRAANGVILVTTKSGEKGKAKIEYSGYYGIQVPAESLIPLNAYDRALLYNETTMRNTTTPTKEYPDQYFKDLLDGKATNTDWYSAVMRETAPQQQHNVSMSGGSDKIDYFVNLGFTDQGSFWVTNSNNYNRYNLRSNLNAQITKNLKASVKLNVIMDETNRQYYSSWDIFKALWRSRPNDAIYANNNKDYLQAPSRNIDLGSVVAAIDPDLSGFVKDKKNIFQSNLNMEYTMPFIKGLKSAFMFSYDKTYNDNTNFKKEYAVFNYNAVNDTYESSSWNGETRLNRYFSNSYTILWNAQLNYTNSFAEKHNVSALLLYEERYSQGYNFSAQRYFTIPIPYLFAGNTENQEGTGGGLDEDANRAVVGRVNYEYGGKYLTEFSFRYDGSSKFPKGKQWGFFPNVQLGYRISEESFIKNNLAFVDNMKIRATWGKLGDDSGARFQFIEGYDYPASDHNRNTVPRGYIFENSFVNALGFRNAPNPNLTWYTAIMKNIGIDIDLWNRLLGLSFDLFQRDREGLLASPTAVVPATFGSGISQANLNADRNKGFEIELRHHNKYAGFNYFVTGSVQITRSMVTKRAQPDRNNSYDYWRNNTVNRYDDVWFGKGANGVYRNWSDIVNSLYAGNGTLPGDPIYQDWNGDGVIDDNDMHPIATTSSNDSGRLPNTNTSDARNYPLMNYNLTLGGSWKCLDFNFQFQGAAMSWIGYGEQLLNPLTWDGNALEMLFDRWHPTDPDVHPYNPTNTWISGYYPYGRTRAEEHSAFNMQKGDYLRLKNAEIGFTVPKSIFLEKTGVKNIRLYINAYNLMTFTHVKGVDPEKPSEGNGYLYPLNRTFNFGGTLTF